MGVEIEGFDDDRKSQETVNSDCSLPAVSMASAAHLANPGNFPMYFMIISAGYMFPWTAICSKIEVLTQLYGKEFFTLMNAYFYISGLPVSLISSWYDNTMDMKYESKNAYTIRTLVCLAFMWILVMILPFTNAQQMSTIVGLLGIFTWSVHGSHSKLAAMLQFNSNIYQQIGFALPAFFSLLLNLTLANPAFWTCFAYFAVIGLCVIISAWCSMKLLRSKLMKVKFIEKDRQSLIDYHNEINEIQQLIQNQKVEGAMQENDEMSASSSSLLTSLTSTSTKFEPMSLSIHALALFFVIFCSILEGSFISFVTPVGTGVKLPTVLFFVRIFTDLAGRPLTMLNIPLWMRSIDGICVMAAARVCLLFVFFAYIFWPHLLFRSDSFIIGLQVVISMSSGFLIILVYESASALFPDSESKRTKGIELLSFYFQLGCAFAAGTAVIITKS